MNPKSIALMVPLCAMAVVACGSVDNYGGDGQSQDAVAETVVHANPDGTLSTKTVYVPLAQANAQLAEKQRLSAGGEGVPIAGLRPQAYYGDVDESCVATDMWINTGATQGGERICFKKNVVGGMGFDNLTLFYFTTAGQVYNHAQSWWAGNETGAFYDHNGIKKPVFTAYKRCDNCGLVNFINLGFD